MAKIYTTLLAAGALLLSGIGTVGAVMNSTPSAQAANDGESEALQQPPASPKFTVEFAITDSKPVVNITQLVAPTILPTYWDFDYETWQYTEVFPEKEIEGPMTIQITKSYNNENGETVTETWREWTEVEPGTDLLKSGPIVDELPENQIGIDLRYVAYAIVDGAKSNEYDGQSNCLAGIRPQRIDDLSASTPGLNGPITIKWIVPNTPIDQEVFPGISYTPAKTYVTRKFREIGSWSDSEPEIIWQKDNPQVNEEITYVDNNGGNPFEPGTYIYEAYSEWEWGTSFASSEVKCGLFPGTPDSPSNITATLVDGGVLIEWSPVTQSSDNGYIDPADIKYCVYRFLGKDDSYNDILELVNEEVIGTECLDNPEGIEKQMIMYYMVVAWNAQGSSYPKSSNGVIVGPPVELPFIETFSTYASYTYGPDMLWTSIDSEGIPGGYSATWQTAQSAYTQDSNGMLVIYPEEPSKGLAYTNFNSWQPSGTASYISGSIDFSGNAQGQVTFRYYGHPEGKATLYVDVMCDATVEEAVEGEGQPFVNLWNGSIYAEEAGWIEKTVDFKGFDNCDVINLRLRATSDQTESDNIFIPACVEYISVDALGTQKPYGPDIDLKFMIDNDNPRVEGSIVAPTMLMGDWETGTPETEITGTMKIKLVKWYSDPYSDTREIIDVMEWTNVSPKEQLTFTDYDIEIGRDLRYRAIAIVGGLESEEWYGSLGVYTGIRPLQAEELMLSADKGQAPVNVSFIIPDGVRNAEDFPGIEYKPTEVYVTRSFRKLDTWDDSDPVVIWGESDPEVDTVINFTDDNNGQPMPEGTYTYNVYVSWHWGESFETSGRIGLFMDAPGTPEDIVATPNVDGVLITWSEVTKPSDIGYLDPSSVTYDVYRYFGYDDTEIIKEGLTETEFTDNLEGIDKQIRISYQIIAKNDKGSSSTWGGISNELIVGPACPLPFVETFSGVGPWELPTSDMLWTTTYSIDGASWAVGSKASATIYDPEYKSVIIEPSEGYKALAYTNFASWYPTGETSYISGDIDFSGHSKGKVTFRYYGHPKGMVKLYVDVMRYDESVVDEGDEAAYETVWSGSINAENEGWIEKTVEFSGFASSDKINLRLRAVNDVIPEDGLFIPACVEYIKVEATDGSTGVGSLNADEISVEYYDMKGMRLAAPVKGQPIIRKSVMNDGTVRTSKVILK